MAGPGRGAGGTDASGGTVGAAGTGSLMPSDFAGGLDGYLFTGECNGGSASFECPMSGCSSNVFNEQVEFNVGGDPLVVYDVTLPVYGDAPRDGRRQHRDHGVRPELPSDHEQRGDGPA